MNSKVETPASEGRPSGILDTLILAAALGILIGGIWVFYKFEGQWPSYVRMLAALLAIALGAFVAFFSERGKQFKSFLFAAQLETRKVVWPTRQETLQTTLLVMVVVVIVGILLWILDSILGFLISTLLGS